MQTSNTKEANRYATTGKDRLPDRWLVILPGLVITIAFICDALVLANLAPLMVLNGPTPGAAYIQYVLPLSITCLALVAMAFSKSAIINRAICLVSLATKPLCLVLVLYLLDSAQDTSVYSGQFLFICLTALFLSGFTLSASLLSTATNKFALWIVILAAIETTQLFLMNQIAKGAQTLIQLEAALTIAFVYIALVALISFHYQRDKNNRTNQVQSLLPYQDKMASVVLTFSLFLLFVPTILCINLAASIDEKLVQLVQLAEVLVSGALAGITWSAICAFRQAHFKTDRLDKGLTRIRLERNVITILLLMPFLSLSRSESLTMFILYLTGFAAASSSIESVKEIFQSWKNPCKAINLSFLVALIVTSFTIIFLCDTALVVPPTYVMQPLGVVSFSTFFLTALSFSRTRRVLLRFMANICLNRSNHKGMLQAQFNQPKSDWIFSKLGLLKTLLVSLYLKCPLIIVTNDGFLNINIVKSFLSLMAVTVYSSPDKARQAMLLGAKERHLVYLQSKNMTTLGHITGPFALDEKLSNNGQRLLSIENTEPARKKTREGLLSIGS